MKKRKKLIEPSIFCGDLGRIAEEAKRIEEAGADAIHIDIMDGHFVPNLSLGPGVVSAINRTTDLFLDVHLMMYNPFEYIEKFISVGADRIIFHFEATEEVKEVIEYIRKCNVKVGLAFNPETSFEMVPKYLDQVDLILFMTVHPGFGGQSFMPEVLEKIRMTREECVVRKIDQRIQVDGGINLETCKLCMEAGADVFVSGSYLFKHPDMKQAIQEMKGRVL